MMPNPGMVAVCATRRRKPIAAEAIFVLSVLLAYLFCTACCAQDNAATTTAGTSSDLQTAGFKHGQWPFQPLARPDVPQLNRLKKWAKNPIDNFTGQKL